MKTKTQNKIQGTVIKSIIVKRFDGDNLLEMVKLSKPIIQDGKNIFYIILINGGRFTVFYETLSEAKESFKQMYNLGK